MVQVVLNPILSPQQHCFVGLVKKFNPHPILVIIKKFKPYQLSIAFWGRESGVQKGGDSSEQQEWNEDNEPKMEVDTQLEADSHPVITPLEKFFDNELEFNKV